MSAEPEQAGGRLLNNAGRTLRTYLEYRALCLVQRPLLLLFWLIEQRKARLDDRFANERSEP